VWLLTSVEYAGPLNPLKNGRNSGTVRERFSGSPREGCQAPTACGYTRAECAELTVVMQLFGQQWHVNAIAVHVPESQFVVLLKSCFGCFPISLHSFMHFCDARRPTEFWDHDGFKCKMQMKASTESPAPCCKLNPSSPSCLRVPNWCLLRNLSNIPG
jgi:hypothetical protein